MGRATTPEDLWRLAGEAERRGIRILVEPISGDTFATSSGDPNILYRLTHLSCTCKGFMVWQRCSHHSLLLSRLGWLPDVDPDPEPEPAAPALPAPPAPCAICDGTGRERLQSATGRSFAVVCDGCGGTGRVAAGAPDAAAPRPPIRPTNPAADELAPWEREAA